MHDDRGLYVGFSPDGLRWTSYEKNPVLPTWPEGYGVSTRYEVGDIVRSPGSSLPIRDTEPHSRFLAASGRPPRQSPSRSAVPAPAAPDGGPASSSG
jgi:hypothetical protein